MTRELLQQALEALDSCTPGDYSTGHVIHPSYGEYSVNAAIKAIRAHLAKPDTAPAWHDKPTTPGDWVIDGKGYRPELQIGITQQEIDRVSDWPGRWYGPIPEDTGGKP